MNFLQGVEAPKSRVVSWKSSFLHAKSSHKAIINNHYFNFRLLSLIPTSNAASLESQLVKLIDEQSHFFYTATASPFLIYTLARQIVSKGYKMYCYTVNAKSDSLHHEFLSIIPHLNNDTDAKLLLRVGKDKFEELGLEGHVTQFRNDKNFESHFYIVIDLQTQKSAKQETRIREALAKLGTSQVVIAVYNDKNEPVDLHLFPIQVPHLQEESSAFTFQVKKIQGFGKVNVQSMKQVPFPSGIIHYELENEQAIGHLQQQQELQFLVHWLGLISCGLSSMPDSSANLKLAMKQTLFKENVTSDAVLVRLMGFIPPHKVNQIIEFTRRFIEKEQIIQEKNLVSSIQVSGLEDSIVSWKLAEHGFGISGENDYYYAIFPDQSYWLLQTLGQKSMYS